MGLETCDCIYKYQLDIVVDALNGKIKNLNDELKEFRKLKTVILQIDVERRTAFEQELHEVTLLLDTFKDIDLCD